MTLRKSTSLALTAVAALVWIGCSSKEDKDKYDQFYGSASKSREEAAVVAIQNERNAPKPEEVPVAASEAPAAAPAAKDTTAGKEVAAAPAAEAAPKRKPIPADVSALLNKNACLACHQPYDKIIGPPYAEVAKKKYTADQIVELVHNPKPEHWPGFPPMAPMTHVPKAEIVVIANWINSL